MTLMQSPIKQLGLSVLVAAVFSISHVSAQSENSPGTAESVNAGAPVETAASDAVVAAASPENIFPSAEDVSGSGILQDRDAYLSNRGWALGHHEDNPGGSYIGWGSADIAVAPESADYGSARIMAVDAAVAEAMGQFALSEGLEAQAEVVRRVIQDPDALQRAQAQSGQNYAKAVFDRVTNLTTAQLDQALEELGVDPARHANLDYSERVTLAEDSIQRGVARQAFQSFRGVRLLKTFEEEGAV